VIRVVVVDDETAVRAGIAMLVNLEQDIAVVGEAADGQEALSQVRALRPDVVLMDVHMPGTDGVAATSAITKERLTSQSGSPVEVVILTHFHISEEVYGALRAGASGFLLKDAAPSEICDAIRAVVSGDGWLDPTVTKRLIREFADRPAHDIPTPTEMATLTPKEREVLACLALGLSNAEVAERLFISVNTVRTHLARVMMKLGVREKAHAVAAAYRTGLVRPADR
jgi:DNA-binding NarL/FixJ family response regulator